MVALFAALQTLALNVRARLGQDEDGGVVIEYGIVVAVIALGLVAVGLALVGAVDEWFSKIAAYVSGLGAPES